MAAGHHEVTRLEGFSDALFGFVLTLLVVSLQVPTSFETLKTRMQGFLGFTPIFATVWWICTSTTGFFDTHWPPGYTPDGGAVGA